MEAYSIKLYIEGSFLGHTTSIRRPRVGEILEYGLRKYKIETIMFDRTIKTYGEAEVVRVAENN